MTDTVENTQRTMIPGMGEEGEKLTAAQNPAARAGGRERNAAGSRADRLSSFELSDFPVLTGREEDWRFTPLKRLGGLHLPEGDDARLTGAAPAVTVAEQAGVTVETVARDDARVGSVLTPDDRVSAAAWNSVSEATVVTISGEVAEPVRIDVVGSSADPAAMHLTVLVEENAQADVVIAHRGTAVLAQNVEFDVRRDARLNVVALQAWEADAVHVSACLLYTSPSPRDGLLSRMPSSA